MLLNSFMLNHIFYCEVRYSQGNHWFLFFEKKIFEVKLHVLFDCFILFVCLNSKRRNWFNIIPKKRKKIEKKFVIFNHKIQGKKILVFIRLQLNCWIKIYYYHLSVVCKWLNYGNHDITRAFALLLRSIIKKKFFIKEETKWIRSE